MKVTSIQQQVKDKSRYSIFIDGTYSFSLSEQALIDAKIIIGQEVDSDELVALKDKSLFDKAYGRVLDLLARRVRSEWELRDYLHRKQHNRPFIDQIINKLQTKGFVNDEDFAKRWVENRRLLKQTSQRKLWQELKAKRINDEIIRQVLDADDTNEKAVLVELATRKFQQSRYKDKTKLMQYLARQGFRYDDIKYAVKQLD